MPPTPRPGERPFRPVGSPCRGRRPPVRAGEHGQATVELVALLPVVAVVGLLLWQAVVAGHVVWSAGAAAAAAARAAAIGGDVASATAAARRALAPSLRGGVRVRLSDDGTASVALRVPAVVGGARLPSVRARARFVPQG